MKLNLVRFFPEGIANWAASHYGLALLLVVSMTLNGLLTWRAIYWRHRAVGAPVAQNRPPSDPLAAMTAVPVLKGKHLDGSDAIVEFKRPGVPTLLYLMSPSCGWCARNLANFKALVEQSKNKYRVVAVSTTTEGLPEYAKKNRLAGPDVELVLDVPESVLQTDDLLATPQTLLISSEGKLIQRWQGAYVGSQAEIEGKLGVRLPGLAD
jgi:hypothetical protein